MRFLALAFVIAVCGLFVGCSQDEVSAFREGVAGDDDLACSIAMARDVRIRDGVCSSHFQAEMELTGLPVDGSDQLHLVWVRPDGLELFRKFGLVTVEALEEGFAVHTTWKDAENLHASKSKREESDQASLTLSSRLSITDQRSPGDYTMRVYWNRELMAENSVTLTAAASDAAPHADIAFCRRIGSKSGKRIEEGDSFEVREGKKYRYVHGLVDLTELPMDETHAFHLVWTGPNGRELFRRSGTLATTAVDAGFEHRIVWFKKDGPEADEPIATDAPELTLSSRLNVDPDRERNTGAYELWFLWDHAPAHRDSFELSL